MYITELLEDITPHESGILCACRECRNGKGRAILIQEIVNGGLDDVEYHLYSYPNPFGKEIVYQYERV